MEAKGDDVEAEDNGVVVGADDNGVVVEAEDIGVVVEAEENGVVLEAIVRLAHTPSALQKAPDAQIAQSVPTSVQLSTALEQLQT